MTLSERALGGNDATERVQVALVAVHCTSGDVLYDDFADDFSRSGVDSRMKTLLPSEVLLPPEGNLSPQTEKVTTVTLLFLFNTHRTSFSHSLNNGNCIEYFALTYRRSLLRFPAAVLLQYRV